METFDPLFGFVFCRHGCSAPNTTSVIHFEGLGAKGSQQNIAILKRKRANDITILWLNISIALWDLIIVENYYFSLFFMNSKDFMFGGSIPNTHILWGVNVCSVGNVVAKHQSIYHDLFSDISAQSKKCRTCYLDILFTISQS